MSDSWSHLRQLTSARIALGRTGGSLPTQALLDFRLAHAHARDAVQSPFETESLTAALEPLGIPLLSLSSAAPDLLTFLRRPDLGRRLDETSRETLIAHAPTTQPHDLVILISNGLSSLAIMENAAPLINALVPLLKAVGWSLAPLLLVKNARVALSDEAGHLVHARIALILLGERPGLGGGDSLGAYFTFDPRLGKTDADRNCVSNIRAGGLPPAQAAAKLAHLLNRSQQLRLSGVNLKDESPSLECGEFSPLSLGGTSPAPQSEAISAPTSGTSPAAQSADESAHSKTSSYPKKHRHHAPPHFETSGTILMLTAGTYQKIPHFSSPEHLDLLQTLAMELFGQYGWKPMAWSFLANHYHAIIAPEVNVQPIAKCLKHLHANTARELNLIKQIPGTKIWHNFWESPITHESSLFARLNYVHQNPVKHGLVPVANQYPWCSAAVFEASAPASRVKTIYSFKTDQLDIPDDF